VLNGDARRHAFNIDTLSILWQYKKCAWGDFFYRFTKLRADQGIFKTLLEKGQNISPTTAGVRVATPTARGCTSEPFGPRISTRPTICVPAAMLLG
jgi:hypothetical protein